MNQERRVDVQHCILTRVTTRHGSQPIYNLLEVCYDYHVAPDTEFPKIVPRFDLFIRWVSKNARRIEVRFRVHFIKRRGEFELMNDWADPTRVLSFPDDRRVVLDQSIRLPNMRLGGPGLHAIVVHCRLIPDPLTEESELFDFDKETTGFDIEGWRTAAVEYVNVARPI
jgi:uncharacterized protein YprB with RNaseH-like and TPR domain